MQVDIEKLRAALVEAGVEEGKIDEILESVSEEEVEETPEGKSEEEITSSETQEEAEEPSGEQEEKGEEEGEPSQEEGEPAPESVPEIPEEPQPELPPEEVVPVEEPPVEEVPGEVPPVDVPPQYVSLEEFAEVKNELEEQKKANEGLLSRISSLEEALKKAGVIDASSDSSVGLDDPQAPGSRVVDTTMDDVLREINKPHY